MPSKTLVLRVLPLGAAAILLGGVIVADQQAPSPADDVRAEPAIVHETNVPLVSASDEVDETNADDTTGDERVVAHLERTGTDTFAMLGVTWAEGADDYRVEVSVKTDDGWSDLETLESEGGETGEAGGRHGTEPVWIEEADGVEVTVLSDSGIAPTDMKIATIDPNGTPGVVQAAGTVGQPKIISRSSWGASSGSTCDKPGPRPSTVTKGVILHHTAGSNSYSKSQSAGIVKGIQAYHTKSQKWCDIGYNFLVDKYGQIFEGRKGGITNQVRGAHSGNGPVNEDTVGIAMMGNFQSVSVPDATRGPVADLIAWRFSLADLPATGSYSLGGKRLQRIDGHRNVVSTACPGAKGYAWLTSSASTGLRPMVAKRLKNELPAGPTGLAATSPDGTSLSFSWNALSLGNPQRYHVKVSKSSSMSSVTYGKFTDTKGSITGLDPATTYYAAVAVVDADRNALISSYTSPIKVETGLLPTPTGLKVTGSSPTSLSFDWDDVDDVERYHVKVSKNADMSSPTFGKFDESEGTVTGLTANTKYYYAVVAVDPSRNERLTEYTSPASVTTPSTASSFPTGLRTTDVTSSSISFAWDAVSGAKKYHVKVSRNADLSGPTFGKFTTNKGTVSGLRSGTKYYFSVVQVNPTNNSRVGSYSTPTQSASTTGTASAAAAASDKKTVPSSRSISFKGHGYGHGIGMSQYGAEGAARDGVKYASILSKYYPGTKLADKSGNIRVLISADTTDSVLVNGQSGLKLEDLSGKRTISLPTTVGGKTVTRWQIVQTEASASRSKLMYRVGSTYKNFEYKGSALTWSGDGQFTGPSAMNLVLPGGSVMKLRGDIRSAKPSSGSSARNTVNVLPIEDYVRGVIAAEMPSSWHAEALKAQAVAARTYGVRSMSSSRYYDICSTTSCQVYGGVSRETSATDSAVKGTAGKILTYSGSPALTQFSSSSGGYTNVGSQPYLKAVSDPWDDWSGNKNHEWTIAVSASTIEKKYPSIGTLKTLEVSKRNGNGSMGGRVSSLKLVGSKASKTISGVDARWAFGLRSDWFGF